MFLACHISSHHQQNALIDVTDFYSSVFLHYTMPMCICLAYHLISGKFNPNSSTFLVIRFISHDLSGIGEPYDPKCRSHEKIINNHDTENCVGIEKHKITRGQ